MIKYRYSEELEIATYYAKKLHDDAVLSILKNGTVENSADAVRLSEFFGIWSMHRSSTNRKTLRYPGPKALSIGTKKL